MKKFSVFVFLMVSGLASILVFAESIRATRLDSAMVSTLLQSEESHVVEFRSGDQIPLNFEATGDLFESKSDFDNVITIKRGFFIKVENQELFFSLDGNTYSPLKDSINGSLSVAADQGQIPSLVQVLLAVYLK